MRHRTRPAEFDNRDCAPVALSAVHSVESVVSKTSAIDPNRQTLSLRIAESPPHLRQVFTGGRGSLDRGLRLSNARQIKAAAADQAAMRTQPDERQQPVEWVLPGGSPNGPGTALRTVENQPDYHTPARCSSTQTAMAGLLIRTTPFVIAGARIQVGGQRDESGVIQINPARSGEVIPER